VIACQRPPPGEGDRSGRRAAPSGSGMLFAWKLMMHRPGRRCRAGDNVSIPASSQDEDGVTETDAGSANRPLAGLSPVEAPPQRAKPPFSQRSEGRRWRQVMWT
jgi:hypothetical protein